MVQLYNLKLKDIKQLQNSKLKYNIDVNMFPTLIIMLLAKYVYFHSF